MPQKIFLDYSTQFVFLKIRLVPGNVVMVAKCGKSPITGDWISEITWKHTYSNISNFFIVDTTSLLKFVFPIAYYFCLGGRLGGCVVVAVVSIYYLFLLIILFSCLFIYLFHLFIHLFIYFYLYIYLFIYLHIYLFVYLLIYWFIYLFVYLFIYSVASTIILVFVVGVVIAAVAFVVGVNVAFCANSMLMFSVLILLCAQCFTVNRCR